jgi:hypothetical protein
MGQQEMLLFGVKLVLAGLAAFLAILLWSKVYDPAWMALAGGAVTGYGGVVYDILRVLGVAESAGRWGTALFTVLPLLFCITAFALRIFGLRKFA